MVTTAYTCTCTWTSRMRLRALKTRRRLRQCRCITSDYISRLPHRTAPGPLSLPRFSRFFPLSFFLRFRLLERERGPGFEAMVIAAGRLPLGACRAKQLTTSDAARSRRTAEAIETGRLATATNFSGVCHRVETERRSKE